MGYYIWSDHLQAFRKRVLEVLLLHLWLLFQAKCVGNLVSCKYYKLVIFLQVFVCRELALTVMV